MKYFFLTMILLGSVSTSFAMERGGGGRDSNRGMHQHRDFQRDDLNRHQNWHRNNEWGGNNVYINPQVNPSENYNAFPDDTEQDEIYQEDLPN